MPVGEGLPESRLPPLPPEPRLSHARYCLAACPPAWLGAPEGSILIAKCPRGSLLRQVEVAPRRQKRSQDPVRKASLADEKSQ